MLALLACVATSAIILVATPLPASADDLLDAHQHMPLINIGSGKCLSLFHKTAPAIGPACPSNSALAALSDPAEGSIDRPIQYYQFLSQGQVSFNEDPSGGFLVGLHRLGVEGYLIRNLDTGLCLDARDGAKSDGSVVQQWTCRDKNARSMVWYVEPGDFPDMFKVRNFNSDLCLDVAWGSSDDSAQLQQYHCTSNNMAQNFSQKFPAFWLWST